MIIFIISCICNIWDDHRSVYSLDIEWRRFLFYFKRPDEYIIAVIYLSFQTSYLQSLKSICTYLLGKPLCLMMSKGKPHTDYTISTF